MKQTDERDPLWDPADGAQLQRWQQVLAPYSAQGRGLLNREAPLARVARTRRRWPLRALAIAATVLLSLWGAQTFRLYWPDGHAWQLHGVLGHTALAPDERLQTADDQYARLSVARIGTVQIAPGSVLRLISSGTGRQRIELEHGRVQARIWAPPGHFGISSGHMQFVDLGCEFTLDRQPDGRGSLSVQSGWVQQFIGGREQLIPAGHSLQFSEHSSGTPLHQDATPALRNALIALDDALQGGHGMSRRDQLAVAVALAARDEDQYTLMNLLLREPSLANGPLYDRLAQALRMPANDAAHRAAWLKREHAAIETWWQRLPSQPKRWWTHWRDAF